MTARSDLVPQPTVTTAGRRPFEIPLLFAGLRCIARYVVLPFALPLLGVAAGPALDIATGAAVGLLVLLDVIAVISIVATLRRLWPHRHPRRWPYLALALALTGLIAVFLVNDLRVLYA
jgi:hypothetical protein